SIERDGGRVRNSNCRVELIESLLKVPVADCVKERAIEIGVERPDDRAVCFFDCHDGQNRTEGRVNVNDVVLPQAKNALQVLSELESPGKSCLRSVRINRLTLADANDVHLGPSARNLRGDDVDLMPVTSRLTREEVYVLADSTQVRVVVLRHE